MVLIGATIVLSLTLQTILAPIVTPTNPLRMNPSRGLQPPMWLGGRSDYTLGSDAIGRDILARTLYGGRVSLGLAFVAALVSGVVGVTLGLVAGYHGRWVDDLIMRIADVQLSFPVVLLAIGIIAVVGTSLFALIAVMALSGWVIHARTVRSVVLSLKQMEFVMAARSGGAETNRVIFRHILPNVQESILVIATVQIATMILLESALSFLGLGTQPPDPSWGAMLAEGREYLSNAWWISTVPGAAISLAVFGFNLLGDGLRDILDPRLRDT